MGENRHSAWQGTLTYFFMVHKHDWSIRVRPSLRTKTSERRYRIPDVAILDAQLPEEPIATTPPLIAFEILSPEDRLSRLITRLGDFENMGVPAIYVIDPVDNSLLRFSQGKLQNVDTVLLRDTVIPYGNILSELD